MPAVHHECDGRDPDHHPVVHGLRMHEARDGLPKMRSEIKTKVAALRKAAITPAR